MPPLDSWLKVTIRMPFLLFPVLVILLIGLVASAVFVYRRLRLELRLSHEAKDLRARLAQHVGQEPQDLSREVYRHFIYCTLAKHGLEVRLTQVCRPITGNTKSSAELGREIPIRSKYSIRIRLGATLVGIADSA
jgi:hypothetical protein